MSERRPAEQQQQPIVEEPAELQQQVQEPSLESGATEARQVNVASGEATEGSREAESYGYAGGYLGSPYAIDIEHTLPRHVGSRILTTAEGDTLWRPATDVFETNENIVVHCDLPGVAKTDLCVDLRGDEMWICGEHREHPFESASSRVRERRIGKFRKIVRLPAGEVNKDRIVAKCENGLLEVVIPKVPERVGKRISIA